MCLEGPGARRRAAVGARIHFSRPTAAAEHAARSSTIFWCNAKRLLALVPTLVITGKSRDGAAAHARRTAAHAKAPPSQRATPRGVRPVFELRAGGSNPKAVPRTAQSPGGLPPLEVDSTHRRLPVASDPSMLTFHGENVPKGTGVMQSELRGELGEEADLSGATWPRSWTRPLGIRDAAVRLGGGEHGAQQPVERPPV